MSPDFLRELYLHALAEKPQVVVECSSGTSTVILARCMQLNGSGKVFSLEHESEYAEKTRRNLERHGLSEWATVLDAPLRLIEANKTSSRWYALDALPNDIAIDMLVIDARRAPPIRWRVIPPDLNCFPACPAMPQSLWTMRRARMNTRCCAYGNWNFPPCSRRPVIVKKAVRY
ncbi:MAG: class I SAM-dependent methyltransferase [Noviherbaspirillum sp.]